MTLGPLTDLVSSIEAGELEQAACEAVITFGGLERDDHRTRAWCLALYGVVESRRKEWPSALDALDEALALAEDAQDPTLADRIRIDRLLPLAHHQPHRFTRAHEEVRRLLRKRPELADVMGTIETHLPLTALGAPARIALPGQLRLVTENHPVELSIPLRGSQVCVGRKRSCDLQLRADAEVSRVHCRIEVHEDGWYVHDLSSTGKTRVHGCTHATGPLKEGATIEIGQTVLKVCA